jgi:hypothetical protein
MFIDGKEMGDFEVCNDMLSNMVAKECLNKEETQLVLETTKEPAASRKHLRAGVSTSTEHELGEQQVTSARPAEAVDAPDWWTVVAPLTTSDDVASSNLKDSGGSQEKSSTEVGGVNAAVLPRSNDLPTLENTSSQDKKGMAMNGDANKTYSVLNPFLWSMSSSNLKDSSSQEENSTDTSGEDGKTTRPTLKSPTSFEDEKVIDGNSEPTGKCSLCRCVLDTSKANLAARGPATDTPSKYHYPASATIFSNNETPMPPDTPSFRIKTALVAIIALSAILITTYASMNYWSNFSTAGPTPTLAQELYHLF